MTPTGPLPEDLETIAAFIDHRLAPAERRAFLERLDREVELYEVFVETVRCRDEDAEPGEEEEEDEEEAVVRPAAWKKWALPAAAAAALAVAVGATALRLGEPSYGEALVASAGLARHLEADWYEQPWSNPRGVTQAGRGPNAAFRLGVYFVDLDFALGAGRDDDARVLAGRLEGLLGRNAPEALLLRRLHDQIVDSPEAATDRLRANAADAATRVAASLGAGRAAYELGRLAEIGKLAARGGQADLLRRRSFRRQLADLSGEDWSEQVAAELDRLRALLAGSGEIDLAEVDRAFTAIIAQG